MARAAGQGVRGHRNDVRDLLGARAAIDIAHGERGGLRKGAAEFGEAAAAGQIRGNKNGIRMQEPGDLRIRDDAEDAVADHRHVVEAALRHEKVDFHGHGVGAHGQWIFRHNATHGLGGIQVRRKNPGAQVTVRDDAAQLAVVEDEQRRCLRLRHRAGGLDDGGIGRHRLYRPQRHLRQARAQQLRRVLLQLVREVGSAAGLRVVKAREVRVLRGDCLKSSARQHKEQAVLDHVKGIA